MNKIYILLGRMSMPCTFKRGYSTVGSQPKKIGGFYADKRS